MAPPAGEREAYSYGQGWVEGALDTAESALEEFFGLDRPSWLTDGYELMPIPCPGGCESITGCVEHPNCAEGRHQVTPNCLQPVEEG